MAFINIYLFKTLLFCILISVFGFKTVFIQIDWVMISDHDLIRLTSK